MDNMLPLAARSKKPNLDRGNTSQANFSSVVDAERPKRRLRDSGVFGLSFNGRFYSGAGFFGEKPARGRVSAFKESNSSAASACVDLPLRTPDFVSMPVTYYLSRPGRVGTITTLLLTQAVKAASGSERARILKRRCPSIIGE
jgi:hypothetical protein